MHTVNIHHAKTHLSQLLSRVELGEEITIANRGVPVAKLVPIPHVVDREASLGIDRSSLKFLRISIPFPAIYFPLLNGKRFETSA